MTTAAELRLMLDEARAMPCTAARIFTCFQQPQTILTHLMLAYARLGEPEKAADAHRRAYQQQHKRLTDLQETGEHVRRAGALAARFDARNGTGRQGALVEAEINAEPYAEKVEFSPRRRAMIEGENR